MQEKRLCCRHKVGTRLRTRSFALEAVPVAKRAFWILGRGAWEEVRRGTLAMLTNGCRQVCSEEIPCQGLHELKDVETETCSAIIFFIRF